MCSSQWSDQLHQRTLCIHRRQKHGWPKISSNWTTTKQKLVIDLLFPFSSSLKPSIASLSDSITLGSHSIPFFDSARNRGFILDSKLSMKKLVIKICQTAYLELKRISSIRRFRNERRSQDSCYFLYHGLTTATVSSWVHLILSSNLSRKFKTLLQDPAITTQHLSWKNCTGFLFQIVLSIKSLVCVSML